MNIIKMIFMSAFMVFFATGFVSKASAAPVDGIFQSLKSPLTSAPMTPAKNCNSEGCEDIVQYFTSTIGQGLCACKCKKNADGSVLYSFVLNDTFNCAATNGAVCNVGPVAGTLSCVNRLPENMSEVCDHATANGLQEMNLAVCSGEVCTQPVNENGDELPGLCVNKRHSPKIGDAIPSADGISCVAEVTRECECKSPL